jgi:putative oxidoreductase
MERVIFLFGRLLIALLFLLAGVAKLTGPEPFLAHMAEHGVPGQLLPLVGIFETLAAICLLTGTALRPASAALAVFCVITAFVFHFDVGNHVERTMFLKDLAIAGGLFAIASFKAAPRYLDDTSFARLGKARLDS